jgi:hypothetical protein
MAGSPQNIRPDGVPSGLERNGMTENQPQRRSPAQVRAANRRLGLILAAVVVLFFAALFAKEMIFGA